MVSYKLTATCGDQSLSLQVSLAYRPGKQAQRARRVAVGELLAILEVDTATVDASGEDQVKVTTKSGTWVIGDTRGVVEGRGRF